MKTVLIAALIGASVTPAFGRDLNHHRQGGASVLAVEQQRPRFDTSPAAERHHNREYDQRLRFGEPWYMDHSAYGPSYRAPALDYQPSAKVIQVPQNMQWNDAVPAPSPSLSTGDVAWPTQAEFREKALQAELACEPVKVSGDVTYWHAALGCR
jgi:hypothetical protein